MAPSITIRVAPVAIQKLATEILESHHEHLLEARILWLVSNAKSTSRGHVLAGKGKKLSPEMRFLSSGLESVDDGYDFVITVYERQWAGLNADQQTAMLDHLLCWCDRKERVNRRTGAVSYSWAIRGPDVEEFTEIVERHGLWRPAIKRLVTAGAQLALPADETIEARLPARTTTVDEQSLVIDTAIEPNGQNMTHEQKLADLDARAAALDEQIADKSVPDSWRQRVGLGRNLWGQSKA